MIPVEDLWIQDDTVVERPVDGSESNIDRSVKPHIDEVEQSDRNGGDAELQDDENRVHHV